MQARGRVVLMLTKKLYVCGFSDFQKVERRQTLMQLMVWLGRHYTGAPRSEAADWQQGNAGGNTRLNQAGI